MMPGRRVRKSTLVALVERPRLLSLPMRGQTHGWRDWQVAKSDVRGSGTIQRFQSETGTGFCMVCHAILCCIAIKTDPAAKKPKSRGQLPLSGCTWRARLNSLGCSAWNTGFHCRGAAQPQTRLIATSDGSRRREGLSARREMTKMTIVTIRMEVRDG